MMVGWQKRVQIYGFKGETDKFIESDFLKRAQSAFGHDNVLGVRKEVKDLELSFLMYFAHKRAAACLDKEILTEITCELLDDESVEIHIEAGGVGTL